MYEPATLADYWMALYSRKIIIFAVAISAMLFAIGITQFLPPIYEAKASFYFPINLIPTSYTSFSRPAQLPLRPLPDNKEAGIHVGILKSNDLIEKVRAKFPKKNIGFFKKNVDFVTSPHFFTDIYVRDRDPKVAADIANVYVQTYREFHAGMLRAAANRAQQVLESQMQELEKKVAAKTVELQIYQEENKLVSGSAAEQLYLNQTMELERQRNNNAVLIGAVRQRLGAQGEEAMQRDLPGRDDSVIQNPRIEQLNKLEARQTALNRRIDELSKATRGTIEKMSTIRKIEAEKAILRQQLLNAETNLAETRLQGEFPNVEIVQVQTAQPPPGPGFPIPTLNAIVALLLGLAAGCYCALLLEYLKRLKIERIRRNLDDSLLQEVVQ